MARLHYFFTMLLLSASVPVCAEPYTLDMQQQDLAGEVEYQISALTFDEIKHHREGWQRNHSAHLSLGFSENSYWLRVELRNSTANSEWYLTLDNTRIDFVDFYLISDAGVHSLLGGDHRSLKGHYSSYPTFKFNLEKSEQAWLYIRVQSDAKIAFNPVVRNSLMYGHYRAIRHQLHYLYLGGMLLFIASQLALNRGRLNVMNLCYGSGLFFGFTYMLFYYGEGNLIFWPDHTLLKNRMYFVFASLSLLSFALFMQKYLRSEILVPRVHKVINFYLLFCVASTIIMFLPVPNLLRVSLIVIQAIAICVLSVLGTVRSMQVGSTWAMGLAIPLVFSVVGLMVYASTFLGLLPYTSLTARLILWTLPLDIFLVTGSFIFRHVSLRREHDKLLARLHEISNSTTQPEQEFNSTDWAGNKSRGISRLSNVNEDETLVKLVQYLENERAFLEPGLTLEAVSTAIDVRPDQLSAIINARLKISFSSLLNIKRLEEAAILLTSEPEKSVLDIALKCGFGSKSSFNRLFKQQFETTPTQYRKILNLKENENNRHG